MKKIFLSLICVGALGLVSCQQCQNYCCDNPTCTCCTGECDCAQCNLAPAEVLTEKAK